MKTPISMSAFFREKAYAHYYQDEYELANKPINEAMMIAA
jgi:hypothetical protein